MPGEGECFLLPHVNNGLRWIFPQITSYGRIQEFDAAKKGSSERRRVFSESIEWFIEDLAFPLSKDLALPPTPTPPPPSRQQAVFFSQSPCVSLGELTDRRGEGTGWVGGGALSYDSEKAWSSMNYSVSVFYFAQSTSSDTVKVLIMFKLLNTIFNFYLLLWNYLLILKMLTETLLRMSFSVIGRCSLVPTTDWLQVNCARINLSQAASEMVFEAGY